MARMRDAIEHSICWRNRNVCAVIVSLSVRLSQVAVLQRWLNLGAQKTKPYDSPGTLVSVARISAIF